MTDEFERVRHANHFECDARIEQLEHDIREARDDLEILRAASLTDATHIALLEEQLEEARAERDGARVLHEIAVRIARETRDELRAWNVRLRGGA